MTGEKTFQKRPTETKRHVRGNYSILYRNIAEEQRKAGIMYRLVLHGGMVDV